MKLDVLINYKEQSFDEEILKATNGEGVDVILDFVEVEVEKVNLLSIMSKCIQLIGTLLTPRSNEYKALLTK